MSIIKTAVPTVGTIDSNTPIDKVKKLIEPAEIIEIAPRRNHKDELVNLTLKKDLRQSHLGFLKAIKLICEIGDPEMSSLLAVHKKIVFSTGRQLASEAEIDELSNSFPEPQGKKPFNPNAQGLSIEEDSSSVKFSFDKENISPF